MVRRGRLSPLGLGLLVLVTGCAPATFEAYLLPNPITRGPRGELALVLGEGEEAGYASLRSCTRARFWIAEGAECPGGTLFLYDREARALRPLADRVLWARFTEQGVLLARAEGWGRTRLALLEGEERELLRHPRFISRAALRGRWLTFQEARPLRLDLLRLFNDAVVLARKGEEAVRPEELRFLQELWRAAGPLWAFDLETHKKEPIRERVVVHRWARDRLLALTLEGDPFREPLKMELVRLEPPDPERGGRRWTSRRVTAWEVEPAAPLFFLSLPPEAFLEVAPDGQAAFVALPMEGLYRVALGEGEPVRVEALRRGAHGAVPSGLPLTDRPT